MSEPSDMEQASELEARYAWLAAMGIPLWLPRESLPGGPDSQTTWKLRKAGIERPSVRTLAPVEAISPDAPATHRDPGKPRIKHDVAAALQQISAPKHSAPPVPEKVESTIPSEPQVPVANTQSGRLDAPIRVAVDVRVAGGWMLLAEHGSGYWGERERRFAADLMFACSADAQASAEGPTFQWPPRDHDSLEKRGDLARDALAGFIEKCADGCEVHSLLCAGSSLAEWLIEAPQEERIVLRGLPADVRRVRLPEMQEMIAHPASKRRAWQILSELAHGS